MQSDTQRAPLQHLNVKSPPAFAAEGIHLFYNLQKEWLIIKDEYGSVEGTTGIDRHKLFLERFAAVSDFLSSTQSRRIKTLFAPSSIGLEPLSFAHKCDLRGLLTNHVEISALDINPRYIRCFNSKAMPGIITRKIKDDPQWNGYYTASSEDEDTMQFTPKLFNAIDMKRPQSLRNHYDQYDMISTFHMIYHLPKGDQLEMLRHLCNISNGIIAIDKATFENEPVRITMLMEQEGFAALNARVHPHTQIVNNGIYTPRKNGEGIMFCREDLIADISSAMENEPSWQPA